MLNISATSIEIKKALNQSKSSFILYIVNEDYDFDSIISNIAFFCHESEILSLPCWDTESYSRLSPSIGISGARIKTIIELSKARIGAKPRILVTSVKALIQKIPPANYFEKYFIKYDVGDHIDRQYLISVLIAGGYVRRSTAESPGEFAVRGSLIDIIGSDKIGYRIDLFDSKIATIKIFDIGSQLSIKKTDNISIYPCSELIISDQSLERFRGNYLQLFGMKDDQMYQEVISGSRYPGIENWLSLFYENLINVFSLLPENALVVSNPVINFDIENLYKRLEDHYQARLVANDHSFNPVRTDALYIEKNYLLKQLNSFNHLEINSSFSIVPNLQSSIKHNGNNIWDQLRDYQEQSRKNIYVSCSSVSGIAKLKVLLRNASLPAAEVFNYDSLAINCIGLCRIGVDQESFETDKSIFLREIDLIGRIPREKKIRAKNDAVNRFFNHVDSIQIDDLLVHAEYGIGRYNGLKSISVENITRDFLEIIYADNDKLFLPVENLDLISIYGGQENAVTLDKLGGTAWQNRKSKLKQRIKIAAESLIKNAANRAAATGIVFEYIFDSYENFCNKFPYVLTEDQEKAVEDIEEDLDSGSVMDRLVCADVGFGKTEIALRASALATLSSNKAQVAIIVPTTLLARQHYATFVSRFKDCNVIVAQLSKFTSRSEVSKIKDDLSLGKIDIIIGTHALLANDVSFKNLGLLVIDEEQHFGVAQKEKLKTLKGSIHVLTLSATPIPRTLQMALSGIRSLSLITTPPITRKPVKTFVIPYDKLTLREALLKEKSRNGLSFYVTPRIAYLNELEKALIKLVPELKVKTAHGGLSSSALDKIMNDFYDHKFDILLSTSIIESGLDISSANTIIVDRAEMFGLSQLHQIRGRVGRSEIESYAYFIASSNKKLSAAASRRLEILASLNSLGSNFSIASHDLDNRGSGNLLGDEQSGHIKEIGIELYQRMLAEAVEQLQKDKSVEFSSEWSPIINLGISIQIPQNYLEDEGLRLDLYRQISIIDEEEEWAVFAQSISDRFGPPPQEVLQLFEIIKIKQLAKKAHISKIDFGEKGFVISFKDKKPLCHTALIDFIAFEREFESKLKPDGKLFLGFRPFNNVVDRLGSIKKVLIKLSNSSDLEGSNEKLN